MSLRVILALLLIVGGSVLLASDGLVQPWSTRSFETARQARSALEAELERAAATLSLTNEQRPYWDAFASARIELVLAQYEVGVAMSGRGPAAVWLPDSTGRRELVLSRYANALRAFRSTLEPLKANLTLEQRRVAGGILLDWPSPWLPSPSSPVARL